MNLSDGPVHVLLNMKRSPLESHGELPRQRHATETSDEDEIMLGEAPVNEEVERDWPDVSPLLFGDWTLASPTARMHSCRKRAS